MKQIIILFFAFISSLSVYCQANNLDDGDKCFSQGDYVCAEAKYNEVFKSAVGKEKQIAEIKIQRAKRCFGNLKNADLAFNGKNYSKAKEYYLAILDSNPNDDYAKSQLEIINSSLNKPKNTTLNLSKTEISYRSSGGNEYINVNTNSKTFTIDLLPSWCTVQKYDTYFVLNCNINYQSTARSDYFNVKAADKTIRVNVTQQGSSQGNENVKGEDNKQTISNKTEQTENSKPQKKYKQKLYSFSSLGIQSGEIAKYGLIYERGGKRTIGFHISVRTSLTPEEDILKGTGIENKTELELGPNFRIFNRLYFNIGIGYGYYDRIINNDYAGEVNLEKTGYSVATTGLMFRISRTININGGASFMDIDKDLYKPEITFGISFNLKGKYSY